MSSLPRQRPKPVDDQTEPNILKSDSVQLQYQSFGIWYFGILPASVVHWPFNSDQYALIKCSPIDHYQ